MTIHRCHSIVRAGLEMPVEAGFVRKDSAASGEALALYESFSAPHRRH